MQGFWGWLGPLLLFGGMVTLFTSFLFDDGSVVAGLLTFLTLAQWLGVLVGLVRLVRGDRPKRYKPAPTEREDHRLF